MLDIKKINLFYSSMGDFMAINKDNHKVLLDHKEYPMSSVHGGILLKKFIFP